MTAPVTVTIEQAHRLYRVRGRMPYGGLVHAPGFVARDLDTAGEKVGELDVDGLARYLEDLADVLVLVATEHEDEHDELVELRAGVAAVRRLFGTEVAR